MCEVPVPWTAFRSLKFNVMTLVGWQTCKYVRDGKKQIKVAQVQEGMFDISHSVGYMLTFSYHPYQWPGASRYECFIVLCAWISCELLFPTCAIKLIIFIRNQIPGWDNTWHLFSKAVSADFHHVNRLLLLGEARTSPLKCNCSNRYPGLACCERYGVHTVNLTTSPWASNRVIGCML